MSKSADMIGAALKRKQPKRRDVIPNCDLLKTGSTILDLAITGRRQGGFAKGFFFWVVGDSSSGKTFLVLTCLAEASINPHFDNYRFFYDNAEDGALMDPQKYFGTRMANRLEAPAVDADGEPIFSETIEDFYYCLDDALTEAERPKGKPFIYILDSMDSLDSKYSGEKFQEAKKAARGGKAAKGDYGDGKAKINSTALRKIRPRLKATGSILIILSQTRDNINAGLFEEKQVHAGGRAMKFYTTVEIWSSVGAKLKKKLNGRTVVIGIRCKVKTKKNRITGKERVVEFPIYYATGIDDIGGMVDWLVFWKFWPKGGKNGVIDAGKHFDGIKGKREEIVRQLEEADLRADLEEIVEESWNKIEAKVAVKRESKYANENE